MKIAIDISQVAYENTGVANYTRELVINLLKHNKNNNYIFFGYSFRNINIINKFISSLTDYTQQFQYFSFRFPQSLGNFIWNKVHSFQLEKLIGEVDIYHSSDWIQIPSKAKKITTIHDLIVYRLPASSEPKIISTQKMRLKHVEKECQMIIADSQSTKKDINEILDIDLEKISVVYPGVNDSFKKIGDKDKESILRKYNIKKPFILAVGKNDPRKNLKRIIGAFKKIRAQAFLVIVSSDGWDETLIQEEKVMILKNINPIDLPAIYSAALMLVYPSLYEGFGLPVIEAQKCGCPVVTSKSGSLREVAGESALFADPLSEDDIAIKIEQLISDRKFVEKLIAKGTINAKRFSWLVASEKITRLYETL